ncbi:MAG TPA: hypothetical protein VJ721_06965 [Chthoniobacterales bacterium]|nr:hypothetical protein [Chthoniobacterales bacterium]
MISIRTQAKEIKDDYAAKATFDKGAAVIQVSIIKRSMPNP